MSDLDELLEFETRHPAAVPLKATAIRKAFKITPARYYQHLARILTTPDLLEQALQSHPTTTHRLLRQRAERAEARKARSL